jgi:hypothetical protein
MSFVGVYIGRICSSVRGGEFIVSFVWDCQFEMMLFGDQVPTCLLVNTDGV